MSKIRKTVTITFGDVAVHKYDSAKNGKLHDSGITFEDMHRISEDFPGITEIYDLSEILEGNRVEVKDAYIMILRNPFPDILESLEPIMFNDTEAGTDEGFLCGLEWDKKMIHMGKLSNKHARYGLCFSREMNNDDYKIENLPDWSEGTTYNINAIPPLSCLQNCLEEMNLGNLQAEGNYYYDLDKCYIRFHRDKERKKVIGYRLGDSMPLHFKWFFEKDSISKMLTVDLHRGDMYMMTELACGFSKMNFTNIYLKHAAGDCKLAFS